MPSVYPGEERGEPVVCPVCDDVIHLLDAYTEREDALTGQSARVHRACTDEGARRWCRENRPKESPLAADRTGWNWVSKI